jgi:uncharacterized protein (TIGR03000 family)
MAPVAAPAYITVNLPPETRLQINGYQTRSTSDVRTFQSPDLQPGQAYRYTLTGELVRNGKTLKATRQVVVHAGDQTSVSLDFATGTLVRK